LPIPPLTHATLWQTVYNNSGDTPAGRLLYGWLATFNQVSYPALGNALPKVALVSAAAAQIKNTTFEGWLVEVQLVETQLRCFGTEVILNMLLKLAFRSSSAANLSVRYLASLGLRIRMCERGILRQTRNLAKSICFGGALLLAAGCGCRVVKKQQGPSLMFLQVPSAAPGGFEPLERITGKVVEAPSGARVVAYAHNGDWYVQPFRSRPFTDVGTNGSWSAVTHLGAEYAALLVSAGYEPPARVSDLPTVGGGVLAVAVTRGSSTPVKLPKVLHFSGYNWNVSSSPSDHGGELSDYEPANAWVDDKGYLHLLMTQEEGLWHCAGIKLTRSLGYGTYRFVVQDSAHLPPSAVLAMFTRDDRHDAEERTELDVELSRWGKTYNRNADYVVQPYYIPENTVHFEVPAGVMSYVLRWDPESATFKTSTEASAGASSRKVMEHTFKSGVPVPASETVHIDFYDFHHAQSGLQHPVEIVVEKFEYLP
jgi:hypothetical protein